MRNLIRPAFAAFVLLAAAGASQASPSTVTVPGLSVRGACPGALVWVGAKIFTSTRVTATNGGGCRYDNIHETNLADLGHEIAPLRPAEVYLQAVGDPDYQTFMRVAARLQDVYVYRLVLGNKTVN